MALGRDETTRIVRFCLAGDGWGTATYEGDAHVLKLVINGADRTEARRFEGGSFEDVLMQAVAAGTLRESCVQKQISFLARPPGRAGRGGNTPVPTDQREPSSRQVALPLGVGLFLEVTARISALVHETQRERGVSSLYAASGGRLFGPELVAQWRVTDQRRDELLAFAERHGTELPSAPAEQLARGGELLRQAMAARSRVEDLQVPPTQVVQRYSHLNAELLRVTDGLLARAIDPRHHATALAWMALLHAKEKTGIERAQLVSAFQRDRYFDGQYQALLGAIAARESYLHLFSAAAPSSVGELMRAKLESDVAGAVHEMEQVALANQRGGFGIDPTDWFAMISRQIELYGDVESAVRGSLEESPRA